MIPWHQLIPATVVNASDSKATISLFRPRTPTQSVLVQPPRSFEEHVQRLPEMQQRLLRQFEFVPGGERALCECLQSHRKLRLASDGSLDPHRELASFGWLLADQKWKCSHQGLGPCGWCSRSPDLHSRRVIWYGCMS